MYNLYSVVQLKVLQIKKVNAKQFILTNIVKSLYFLICFKKIVRCIFCLFHFFVVSYKFFVECIINVYFPTNRKNFTSSDPINASCFMILSSVSLVSMEKTFFSTKSFPVLLFQKYATHLFIFFSNNHVLKANRYTFFTSSKSVTVLGAI